MQTPLMHVSSSVHALPSLQLVPSTALGLVHAPVAGLQTPATWQASSGAHVAATPTHDPAWHVSFVEQRLPSLQDAPFERAPHVPFTAAPAATLHARQSFGSPPPHALSQQTPSTQNPSGHWLPVVHCD